MAIVSVGPMFETWTHSKDLPNVQRFGCKFAVILDSQMHNAVEIRQAAGVPQFGDVLSFAPGCRVRSQNVSCADPSGLKWGVDITWSNEVNEEDEDENPFNRRTKIRVTWVPEQEIAEKTRFGLPIINSACSPFLDPLYRDNYRKRISFTRNEPAIPDHAEPYLGKVNDSTWYGYPAGEAKLTAVDHSDLVTEGEYQYYVVTYVVDIRKLKTSSKGQLISGWAREILDQGMRRKGIPGQGSRPIYMGDPPVEVTTPVNLNGQGEPLMDQSKQEFLVFEIDYLANLNALNLP